MKKTIILCIAVLVSVSMFAQTAILSQIKDTADCRKWVESQLENMTLKQKIGQLFIHTVEPSLMQRNKANIRKAIEEYGLGGLLFSKGKTEDQVRLTNLAQQWSEVPLLITFDGEWGLAMRLKDTPDFPKNRILGCIENDSLIYLYGREVARQLREIGVQVNFAPVADVDNNPANPVINVRSFGSGPKEVARKVIAYARGLEDGGVLAVCKHFPGHGDTETDSHQALPVLNFDRARLDSVELYPFRKAVEAGIGGMMVGHLQVSEIEDKPASVSPGIITSVLRNELRFSGLVFTDALEMKGIRHAENVCAKALIAGNDMVLAPRNLKREMAGVLSAVKKGLLSEEAITEKCRKVLTYKYALGLKERPLINEKGIARRISTPETDSLLAALDKAAVTVLKDSVETLPLELSLSGNVLLSVSPTLAEAYPFYHELKEALSVSWVHAKADSLASIRERLRTAQQVIVALHQKDCKAYLPLVREFAEDKPLVVVCFQPQDALEEMAEGLQKASAIVLAHTDKDYIQRYVADVMTGKAKVTGKASVGIAGLCPAGTGIVIDPEHPHLYTPEDFGMDSRTLARIDTIAEEGIGAQAYPGCHVLILKEGCPIYNKCFGRYTYDAASPEVKENSLYDLASLSKVTGTLLAVMKLYDEGKFGLTDPISRYLPWLEDTDKKDITIQDLLFHESGLPAYWPFYEEALRMESCKGGLFRKRKDKHHQLQVDEHLYACTGFSYNAEWVSALPSAKYNLPLSDSLYLNAGFRNKIRGQLAEVPLKGHSYRYSCLNFMLLQEMVEELARMPMDVYLDSVFYKPMGLMHTAYNPLRHFPKAQIVPTVEEDFLRKGRVQGFVHDEIAAFMGGVSGNAGLFSTAHDVGIIFQMLLDKGVCGDRRYLSRATCDLFINVQSNISRRGLGFDRPDADNTSKSPCAREAPRSVFGHTGFTGTCAWADPDNGLVFVFLSNRIYPRAFDHKNLMKLDIRSRMQQAMYQSIKR